MFSDLETSLAAISLNKWPGSPVAAAVFEKASVTTGYCSLNPRREGSPSGVVIDQVPPGDWSGKVGSAG